MLPLFGIFDFVKYFVQMKCWINEEEPKHEEQASKHKIVYRNFCNKPYNFAIKCTIYDSYAQNSH